MPLKLTYHSHTLRFKFKAGTSRGTLTEKDSWIIKLWDTSIPEVYGLGECGPLKGLSPDFDVDIERELIRIAGDLKGLAISDIKNKDWSNQVSKDFPSIIFGLETASLDLINGGTRQIFDNAFSRGTASIPINGLIWMGDKQFMLDQIEQKLDAGFGCLKLKIGAINFNQELSVLKSIRQSYAEKDLILRVDANGAFSPSEAIVKLNSLSEFGIHSIEQPIAAGQAEQMAWLCENSPISIALDEELIGVNSKADKVKLLKTIQPQFIILKPTLIGGMYSTQEWIEIATDLKIGWWMTSALESNIGLNAIAQLTANYQTDMYQGLGTGQLYHNNFESPLTITNGYIHYHPDKGWELKDFDALS
ncbi:MAG: o-succinylbenzoate synthase [Cyclobacteriaceae bacterium]